MCRAGWENSHCQYAGGQLFPDPHGNTTGVSQHKAHIRELVNYFLIDVAQVYRVYMIWEFAINAAMCNTYSIIILADNCGSWVICHCGMSRGHCWILGTPLSSVFWQLTIPLKLYNKIIYNIKPTVQFSTQKKTKKKAILERVET